MCIERTSWRGEELQCIINCGRLLIVFLLHLPFTLLWYIKLRITDGDCKPAAIDDIENNWIVEHAHQVNFKIIFVIYWLNFLNFLYAPYPSFIFHSSLSPHPPSLPPYHPPSHPPSLPPTLQFWNKMPEIIPQKFLKINNMFGLF